jgi:membrane-bound ClpP family serine protease
MSAPGDPPNGGPNLPLGGYGQNPAGLGPGYGAPPAQPRNGFGIAALVLGLLAVVLSWTIIGGGVFGILALVFGLLGRARAKRGEATNGGLSIAGVILGLIGLLIAIGLIAFGVSVLNSPAGRNYQQCVEQSGGDTAKIQQCASEFGRQVGGG